jgi:hypothetical protein
MLLKFACTWTASLQLAILALKSVPMRPAVAYRTNPLNERGFGLEQVE